MRRFDCRTSVAALCAVLALCGMGRTVHAQEPTPPGGSEPSPPGSEPTPPPTGGEPTPPGAGEPTPPGEEKAEKPAEKGKLGSISWRDIVTVPRRPILKYHRVELVPTFGLTINN